MIVTDWNGHSNVIINLSVGIILAVIFFLVFGSDAIKRGNNEIFLRL